MISKRIRIIGFCVLLVASILIVLSVLRPERESEDLDGQSAGESSAKSRSEVKTEAVPSEISASEAAIQKAARYKELRAQENTDIVFFGKVVNQTGTGIEGCSVVFQVSGYEDAENSNSDGTFEVSNATTSNTDGLFTIDGLKGRSLRILEIKKEGYALESGGRFSFTYGTRFGERHNAEASKPVLFEMIQVDEGAVLLPINERLDVAAKRDEVILPLKVESPYETLKLKLSFDRNENTQSDNYDWSYSVKLIDGAVQEASGGTLLEAPQGGYIEEVIQEYDASSAGWTMRSQKLLYLKLNDSSTHAGIKLVVFSYKDGRSRIIINGNLNPDGRLVVVGH